MRKKDKLLTEMQLTKREAQRTKGGWRCSRFGARHPNLAGGFWAILYAVVFALCAGIPVASRVQLRLDMENLPKDSPAYFMHMMYLRNSALIGIDYDSTQSEHFVICMLESDRFPCVGILGDGEYKLPEKIYGGVQNSLHALYSRVYANTSTDDYLVVVIPDLFTNATKALDPLQISILDENGTPYQLFTSAKSGYSVFFAEYDSAPFGIQLYAVLAETGEAIEIGSLTDIYPLT